MSTRTSERTLTQRVAAFVSGAALVVLIVNLAQFGLDNLKEAVRIVLLAGTLTVAVWWLQTRHRARWVGWVLAILSGVVLVFSALSFGVQGFSGFFTVLVLALVCIVTAIYAFSSGGTRQEPNH